MTKPTPHYSPFGSLISNRSWSDASRVYRYGFNGKEKENKTANDNYDFGARIYDGRIIRWLKVDNMNHSYPSFSPYNFALNIPTKLVDFKGNDPIDPLTGKTFNIRLNYHAVISFGIGGAKDSLDNGLNKSVNRWSWMGGRDHNKGTLWEGAADFGPEKTTFWMSNNAMLYVINHLPKGTTDGDNNILSTFGAPNYNAWGYAARSGNYTFMDEYAESDIGHFNKVHRNIYTVRNNQITEIIRLKLNGSLYSLDSRTTYSVSKSEIKTETKYHSFLFWEWTTEDKYREVSVTSTTEYFNDKGEVSSTSVSTTTYREEVK